METPEEFMPSNTHLIHDLHLPVKPRRNKRSLKLISAGGAAGGAAVDHATSSSSSSISGEISTEEEEDMANCLILLAQGDHGDDRLRRPTQFLQEGLKIDRITSKRFNFETMAKAGFYVYECKTCNRTFPSFQALGGHRASHKKPKTIAVTEEQLEEPQLFNKISPVPAPVAIAVQTPTKTVVATNFQAQKGGKIHECSICGLEFTSGQALGGHMRRHRATVAVSSAQQVVATNTDGNHNHNHNHNHQNSCSSSAVVASMKQRNILELDLNLPAPEEDLRETKFQFTATPQTIVFSAPTLVDCHY